MIIPNKIKFLGHEYRISQVTANEIEGCNGQTWLKLLEIRIDKDLPQSRKESVLLHEIIEIVNAHLELDLEHRKIEVLEEILYSIFKDNGFSFGQVEDE